MKHNFRDLKRRKCHFCLAFCSVFIVIIFTLVINTLVAKGPIIFLKMAQGNQGEYDGIITSSQITTSFNSVAYNREGIFINYTRIAELYQEKYNLSPRKYICGIQISSDLYNPMIYYTDDTTSSTGQWKSQFDKETGFPSRDQMYGGNMFNTGTVCIIFMDTEREKEIGLATEYKFEPLKYGECNINSKQQEILGIKEGDFVYFEMNAGVLLNNLI